jgi:hypothetical protein
VWSSAARVRWLGAMAPTCTSSMYRHVSKLLHALATVKAVSQPPAHQRSADYNVSPMALCDLARRRPSQSILLTHLVLLQVQPLACCCCAGAHDRRQAQTIIHNTAHSDTPECSDSERQLSDSKARVERINSSEREVELRYYSLGRLRSAGPSCRRYTALRFLCCCCSVPSLFMPFHRSSARAADWLPPSHRQSASCSCHLLASACRAPQRAGSPHPHPHLCILYLYPARTTYLHLPTWA